MKRFRVTLLVVCLLLGWLGYNDLNLLLRNREPQQLTISALESESPKREWLSISDGYQDLLQAINMSGTIEIDSFLVPLKRSVNASDTYVWFETRDPKIVELLKTYYFKLDTDIERQNFVQANLNIINARRTVTGMTADNLVADSNRDKLKDLLQNMNMTVPDNVIFISEGKEPTYLRGVFFAVIALVGLLKLALGLKSSSNRTTEVIKNN